MPDYPSILDACCGSKMFWFDREDPRAVFVDKRAQRASEWRKLERLLNLAASLNHSNQVIEKIAEMERLAGDLTRTDYEACRKSFATWAREKLFSE